MMIWEVSYVMDGYFCTETYMGTQEELNVHIVGLWKMGGRNISHWLIAGDKERRDNAEVH